MARAIRDDSGACALVSCAAREVVGPGDEARELPGRPAAAFSRVVPQALPVLSSACSRLSLVLGLVPPPRDGHDARHGPLRSDAAGSQHRVEVNSSPAVPVRLFARGSGGQMSSTGGVGALPCPLAACQPGSELRKCGDQRQAARPQQRATQEQAHERIRIGLQPKSRGPTWRPRCAGVHGTEVRVQ